jgi:RNA polymerase sigma-70 factor (ECF subfamily)
LTEQPSSPVAHPEDLALAQGASAGEGRAWDRLIDQYGQRIYNLAFHFAGEPAGAEDLTQEIFLKLYRSLHRYRGDVPLVAWALRLSRNLCIDHYRSTRTAQRATVVSEEILSHMASDDDPGARAVRRERLRTVYGALERMPEELATVVLLRDLQGFSYEEIVEMLEIPSGTLKSRLNRARRELAERVSEMLSSATSIPGGFARPEASPC